MVLLNDKYLQNKGKVYINGIQALVRLPMMQKQLDIQNNLNTAGFISGYRGSPLGSLDKNLWNAQKYLKINKIHFQPGINEDLGATAVWGSQQVNMFDGAQYDGVFGMWYGKGPGVDRCGDVFKHANANGTSLFGGVLAIAGDDHSCKSSTLPHQSEQAFIASMIPILNPSNIEDIIEFGLFGWALSRYSGLWIGMKIISENADCSSSINIAPLPKFIIPKFEIPNGGLNIRWPDSPIEQEERLINFKLPAAKAFVYANNFDKVIFKSKIPKLNIITTGKSYLDTLQALDNLGISFKQALDIGISIYKVGMNWPLETEKIKQFIKGTKQVLIIEEKRSLIENQLKEALYNEKTRIQILGKELLPETYELNPAIISKVIANLIADYHQTENIKKHLEVIETTQQFLNNYTANAERSPHYCSGCPHNTSTKVPEGSRAIAGIGCHYMATWIYPQTTTFTHMGGEGVPWIGQSNFTDQDHIFANLGDGTYFHSGSLAIRAAVSAKVNITYKILYNDAVAMTGGQPIDGTLTVAQITHQVHYDGVEKIVIITDNLNKYRGIAEVSHLTEIYSREKFNQVQEELKKYKGVSVLIYDQICATEKRRKIKQGLIKDVNEHIIINELVCEGCGDCSVKSNCLSVIPVETEFGTKRTIDQSSCNKDFSCVNGFCPSFVSVHGGTLKKPSLSSFNFNEYNVPTPVLPKLNKPYNILIAGVGGTGIVTIDALLGMAAHIEGKNVTVLDQTGLSQKYGSVFGHIRISNKNNLYSSRIGSNDADLLLGCDILTASSSKEVLGLISNKTKAVINDYKSITGDFINNSSWFEIVNIEKINNKNISFINSTNLMNKLIGDNIASNMFILGYAYQQGLIPLKYESIFEAIELNNVSVKMNKKAFEYGRLAAHNPDHIKYLAGELQKPEKTWEEKYEERKKFLVDYESKKYSKKYSDLVDWVSERDTGELRDVVMKNYFKLMAYKDEYEIARLYSDKSFMKQIKNDFEGKTTFSFHLAPPLFSRKDKLTGELYKSEYGQWILPVFNILSKFKFLRGTIFDIFGYTKERKLERKLMYDYEIHVKLFLYSKDQLDKYDYNKLVEYFSLPEMIKGYGHIKMRNIIKSEKRRNELLKKGGLSK